MCEIENLIICVEKYPCIWDINHADYHNRDSKEASWEQICKEIYNDWETCTDKSNKCAQIKKKWTNIRDYYRKQVQRVPSSNAAKKSKTYIYSKLLYFLTPIFSKRDSEGNYPKDDSEPMQSLNDEQINEPEAINQMESPEPIFPVVNQKGNEDILNELLNKLQQKQKQTAANIDEDDDTKYLLSFRTYMKEMNAHQKIDFKIGMLQLVKKVTMGNDSQYSYQHNDDCSGSFPLVGNISSPSPTFVTSFKTSPIHLQSPSPSPSTSYPSPPQQIIPSTSISKPR